MTTTDIFRVDSWRGYIGQDKMKKRISLNIESAQNRRAERLDHVFLHGPSGCGKTTFASLIAKKGNRHFLSTCAPFDGMALVKAVAGNRGVLFIDEFHRFSKSQQEEWLTFLEDGFIHTKEGTKIENRRLTIIAATTERESIEKAVLDRFMIRPEFQPYTDQEMTKIAVGMLQTAKELEFKSKEERNQYAKAFASAAAGVPRNISRLVLTLRDLGNQSSVEQVLALCDVTEDGLTELQVKYLTALHKNGGRMGAANMAVILQLNSSMLKDVEMLFVERGWVEWTARGRTLTGDGYARTMDLVLED